MSEENESLPTHKELEKELSAYLTKKYGDRIKIISPVVIPQKEAFEDDNAEGEKRKGRAKINFSIKPEELETFLDQYIIQQANAKAILSTKICTHFNRIRYAQTHPEYEQDIVGAIKNNILLIGPTGVGKTYIIKLIANKIGVPFIKCDATKFSETGYVGGDVEDIIRDLVREANDDIELAECGIIYIDEIDKLAGTPNLVGPDVSRAGVQRALLKPMEETEVDLKTPHDPISVLQEIEQYRKTGKRERRTVNTKNILFIMSGAFNDLTEIIKKRLVDRGIGFTSTMTNKKEDNSDFLRETKADDLIKFGFESEFIGRIPVTTVLDKLSEEDLYAILKNPNNPVILNKKKDFKAYGIDIKFSDKALHLLAKKGYDEQTGARGLVSAIEKIVLDFEKKLPSTDIKQFAVTKSVVEDPARELKALLAAPFDPQWDTVFEKIKEEEQASLKTYITGNQKDFIQRYGLTLNESQLALIALCYTTQAIDVHTIFEKIQSMYAQIKQLEGYFMKSNGIQIVFDDEARDLIASMVIASKKTFGDFYKTLKRDFEYGLKLIQEKTAQQKFTITKEGLENPEQYLNAMIKEQYIEDIEKVFEQHD